jgi:hypothetical protein
MAGFGDEAHGSESPSRTKRMSESSFNFNVGTAVFAAFSVLSFVVCLARGLVPIYFVESVLWAAVAWYWKKKNITNSKANLVVLWLAIAIAAGESYSVGHKVGLRLLPYIRQGSDLPSPNLGTAEPQKSSIDN